MYIAGASSFISVPVPEVIADVLTDTSINISWSITDSGINGFVVTVVLSMDPV